ncbi:amidohydrolase family protein [Arthrobacter sp. NPDC080073]|uniref:dihydroorotase n=1 Tax=Arthrobacter sp. NPDC080073 TaxID=3155919 RepID=UPI003444F119
MTELQLIIKNARLNTDDQELYNIGVRDGVIVALTGQAEDLGTAAETLDAAGRWVIPGAIDTHSHINQRAPEYNDLPGFGPDDNFAVESKGALAGGCTTALNYAQFGLGSMLEAYREGLRAAGQQSMMNVLFHGYVMNMEQVAEIPQAVAEGVTTFKLFMPYRGEEAAALGGIGSLNHAQMRMAFREIARHGVQALVHAEDGDIVDHCMQHEISTGMTSLASWERSRPTEAEGDAAWTALYLAEKANCPVTIVHVSSLEAIRARRAAGYSDAALESCVHYMLLTTSSGIGPEGKVAPPLRDPELAAAITDAVLNGEIDFFGSDHNVWPSAAKTDWVTARPGLPGIALMLPLLLTHLVYEHGMSMERAIELTSTNAARRFNLPNKGHVSIGADADLVILDEGERVVRANELHSAVDYSPYDGYVLKTWPSATVVGGTVVFRDGVFPNEDFRGEIINDRFRRDVAGVQGPDADLVGSIG